MLSGTLSLTCIQLQKRPADHGDDKPCISISGERRAAGGADLERYAFLGQPHADTEANQATISADPFIQIFITDLLRSLRTQYIIDIIKPYTRMELSYLAKTLNVSRPEAEGLVVNLILDGKIKGRIDQVEGLLVLDRLYVYTQFATSGVVNVLI